ncbi:hypothetical protein BU14_0093s0007 [Porphyra umbilicalis]|uniref:Uncharacterized protein n=1 Tax=Porphyra umbilicalis TaxID=2786 RepID=A0A1X6PDN8_PORUM|nr:hypothetical protein BU14_0093s0007 [Porphyra umbilicalis]|eukprot:OSX78964.1 hypothetical protein BU14_0093s0007 [Porphyra umbilicalis]
MIFGGARAAGRCAAQRRAAHQSGGGAPTRRVDATKAGARRRGAHCGGNHLTGGVWPAGRWPPGGGATSRSACPPSVVPSPSAGWRGGGVAAASHLGRGWVSRLASHATRPSASARRWHWHGRGGRCGWWRGAPDRADRAFPMTRHLTRRRRRAPLGGHGMAASGVGARRCPRWRQLAPMKAALCAAVDRRGQRRCGAARARGSVFFVLTAVAALVLPLFPTSGRRWRSLRWSC